MTAVEQEVATEVDSERFPVIVLVSEISYPGNPAGALCVSAP
jgi:hypothetical protein